MTTENTTPETVVVPPVAKFGTREQYLAVLQRLGVAHQAQSGFIRVEGPKGNRLYVASTKTVRRVDISGFEAPITIAQTPHMGVFGNVKQQMILTGEAEKDLARFEELVGIMLNQSPKTPAPRVAKPKVEKVVAPSVDPAEEAAKAQAAKEAKLALIRKVAAEKGVSVSQKVLASE